LAGKRKQFGFDEPALGGIRPCGYRGNGSGGENRTEMAALPDELLHRRDASRDRRRHCRQAHEYRNDPDLRRAGKTRDTLSDLNKQNKFNASKYNFLRNVATSDAETTSTANLALWGGGTVEYDYRIFKNGSKIKVQITDIRR
jgi:hypothetical protein